MHRIQDGFPCGAWKPAKKRCPFHLSPPAHPSLRGAQQRGSPERCEATVAKTSCVTSPPFTWAWFSGLLRCRSQRRCPLHPSPPAHPSLRGAQQRGSPGRCEATVTKTSCVTSPPFAQTRRILWIASLPLAKTARPRSLKPPALLHPPLHKHAASSGLLCWRSQSRVRRPLPPVK